MTTLQLPSFSVTRQFSLKGLNLPYSDTRKMVPKPELNTSNPCNPSHSIHHTPMATYSPTHEKNEPQLHLKGAEERLGSNTPALRLAAPMEVEDQYYVDDDDCSNYDDSESEAEITEDTVPSVPRRESFSDHHHHNRCSPESYAEFTVNPYSWSSSVTVDRLPDSTGNKNQEPEWDRSSLSSSSSKKGMGANVREACQRSIRRRTQNMEEILGTLSSTFNSAYSAVKAEGSASLQFLRGLCPGRL
ncbi:hypothetical protein F4776DRAFT_647174 [Hypoxylon sp. NC0597]|nr:hypothetical protein F4776DRAFT_647174 [Hypoxylon sp. NC0597]